MYGAEAREFTHLHKATGATGGRETGAEAREFTHLHKSPDFASPVDETQPLRKRRPNLGRVVCSRPAAGSRGIQPGVKLQSSFSRLLCCREIPFLVQRQTQIVIGTRIVRS